MAASRRLQTFVLKADNEVKCGLSVFASLVFDLTGSVPRIAAKVPCIARWYIW
jgi:hypothetical protein